MSSDEIFASHMWPWPDPMLKRDAHGRILFVNAAFLRIYGGQVHDWHGNSVAGWPVPLGGPAPSRFETRLASPQGELIYDWVEYTLADGGTLGLGRDVTELLPAPEPDPGQSAVPQHAELPPVYQEQALAAPAASTYPSAQNLEAALAQETYAPQAPAAQMTHHTAADDVTVPQFDIPQFEAEAVEIPSVEIPEFRPAQYEGPEQTVAQSEDPAIEAPRAETPAAETPAAQAPAINPTPLRPADRDYERRALPLESETSVLGTNWRDAVIAKAVGSALPTAETDSETPKKDIPAAEESRKAERTLRILLAEDNAINALLTRTLLEADGCDVDVVEDGALAVEAMKSQSYDMIFMDMRMPNMDGLESTRKIRALPNVPKSMPIVALTANAFDDDRNACFDSGMNDFMTKPVSAEELSDMVNQWARKGQDAAA